jgi:hypothetical protein
MFYEIVIAPGYTPEVSTAADGKPHVNLYFACWPSQQSKTIFPVQTAQAHMLCPALIAVTYRALSA